MRIQYSNMLYYIFTSMYNTECMGGKKKQARKSANRLSSSKTELVSCLLHTWELGLLNLCYSDSDSTHLVPKRQDGLLSTPSECCASCLISCHWWHLEWRSTGHLGPTKTLNSRGESGTVLNQNWNPPCTSLRQRSHVQLHSRQHLQIVNMI